MVGREAQVPGTSASIQIDQSDLQSVVDNSRSKNHLLLVDKGGRVVGVWPEPNAENNNSASAASASIPPSADQSYRVTSHGQVVSSDGHSSTYHLVEVSGESGSSDFRNAPFSRPPPLNPLPSVASTTSTASYNDDEVAPVSFSAVSAADAAAMAAAAGTFSAGVGSPTRGNGKRHRRRGGSASGSGRSGSESRGSGSEHEGAARDGRRVCAHSDGAAAARAVSNAAAAAAASTSAVAAASSSPANGGPPLLLPNPLASAPGIADAIRRTATPNGLVVPPTPVLPTAPLPAPLPQVGWASQPYPVHLTPHPHLTSAAMPLPIPLAVHGALPPTAPFIPLQPPSYIPLHHPTTTASTTTLPPPRLLPTAAVQTALPQPLFDGERVAAAAAQAQAAQVAAVRATAAAQAVAASTASVGGVRLQQGPPAMPVARVAQQARAVAVQPVPVVTTTAAVSPQPPQQTTAITPPLPPAVVSSNSMKGVGQAEGLVWDVYTTGSTAYYMDTGDPNPVLIEPLPQHHPNAPPPQPIPVPPPGSRVAIGLVTMTKQPLDLPTWLHYHHHHVGICKFFIKVEDTPELASLFATPPWDRLVVATFDDGTQRDYFAQMDRQSAHIAASLPQARTMGLTHVLHIDDDELLYCSLGAERLHAELACAPAERPDCHMFNVEALFPASNCANPFREATCFRHLPTRYVSYTNGKSIGRLDAPTLRSHGPHHFRTSAAAGGKGSAVTHQIAAEVGVVLHYESATYAKWHTKYIDLAARHGADQEVYARVPFAFYRKSMAAAYAILVARRSGDAAAEAEAVAASHALWCEHKLAPRGLPPPSRMPRRLQDGLTVLWPFADATSAAAGSSSSENR